MPDIHLRFGKDIIVIDGAMGTMLTNEGISGDECFLLLNVLDDELITMIHERYKLAGAQVITSNSFGGTRTKLAEHGLEDRLVELNRAAVRLARKVRPEHVFADVGPCGLVLAPLGGATFEQVFAEYAEQIAALASENPDAILIETMTDIADARCAVLAAKSICDLPVFITCTFDVSGRMPLSGTDPQTAAVILEAVGANAVGINCGLGPRQSLPLIKEMSRATALPLIVQPNAGMPVLNAAGQTIYSGTADDFSSAAWAFRDLGVQFIGSCCGTKPAYTGAIYATVGGLDVKRRQSPLFRDKPVVASPRKTVTLGAEIPLVVIGERINPTGKPALAAELESGSLSRLRQLAQSQEQDGALLVDVNVGTPAVDAKTVLPAAARALSAFISSPLVFDTTDYDALEKALRVYPGKALINSVNGEEEACSRVFSLARKYGAAVIALTMDNTGIPESVEGRLQIADRIRKSAQAAGLRDSDLVFDALTLTAATDVSAPSITLQTIKQLYERGLSTVLGISNVSHGLPDRPELNAAFLIAAVSAGLSAAIVNPGDPIIKDTADALNSKALEIYFEDACAQWNATLKKALKKAADTADTSASLRRVIKTRAMKISKYSGINETLQPEELLRQAILRGDVDSVSAHIDAVVATGFRVEGIVDALLAPTLTELGEAFSQGEVFLPQLILAAKTMKVAIKQMKSHLHEAEREQTAGRVLFCTVQGDVHSIGKDICIALLESQGYSVLDLGVDVPAEEIITAAKSEEVDVICLSALMTTTLPAMKSTVEQIFVELPEYSKSNGRAVAVGGAVVTPQWAESIGARYSKDAPGCVALIQSIIKKPDVAL